MKRDLSDVSITRTVEAAPAEAEVRPRRMTAPLVDAERAALLLPSAETLPPNSLGKSLRGYDFQERRLLLLLGDAYLLSVLYLLVSVHLQLRPSDYLVPFGCFVVAVFLVANWLLDLYSQSPYRFSYFRSAQEARVGISSMFGALSTAVMVATLVIGTVAFFRVHWFPVEPKGLVVLALGAIVLLCAWRLFFFRLFNVTLGKKRTIVIGAGATAQDLVLLNRQYPHLGYEIIGYVDDRPDLADAALLGLPVLGSCLDLRDLVAQHDCDTLLIGITGPKSPEALRAIADCLLTGAEIIPAAEVYERYFGVIPLKAISHSWFVYNMSRANRGLYLGLKRLIDVLGACTGLMLACPIAVLVAAAIRLDSPGPVLYSQMRVGERGRQFRIYKFRSMRTDAEVAGPAWAQREDPRVTRLGRFLRKTRLDELPQLVNVLRGELSLVGPRPERPEFIEELKQKIPYYDRRHMVKPGLTGWAQVRFYYGASVHDTLEKLQYDFFYIKNRTLLLDLEIVMRTVWVVISRKGAR